MQNPAESVAWWKRGVIYQIYPRSFQDSGGDGIGDLAGIGRRLDHVAALGVDAKRSQVSWETQTIGGSGEEDWRNRKVEVSVDP